MERSVKFERSVKLCQLIYDRPIVNEIGYEIRKLLEEGVLIDFQDQNRNKKTAIHLAVLKCDVICVKFLLQFRPSLEVKDDDGKTPVDLARLCGCQNILNGLLNSTFDIVNESYVEVIDFESLTLQKIEAIKLKPTFKVLKLTNCPSVNHVWIMFKIYGYTATLNESSHLFFIIIETKKTNIQNDHELMKKVLNLRRPMIIQLTSSKSQQSRIHFKDDKKDFVKISDEKLITQEEFYEAIQSRDHCNMKLLIAALRSNLFGHSSGDLLDTKLNTNEDRREAVNHFAKSNALCHRFFKLFDESPPNIERIIATLSFKGDQSLLALLDLPFEPKDGKLNLNEFQQDILNIVDSSGCNLLVMAAELDHLDAVKLLLRCGCDFNRSDNYDNRAADICWEMKAFDYLAELIEAGSPYPSNFCIDKVDELSEAHERINKIIEGINLFHENIVHGKIEEVSKFTEGHPHIKHAFDPNNKCALTVALQSNQVDIYSLLMSVGFEPGADDEYYRALDKSKFKNKIRKSHSKYFKEAFDEPHLKRLLKMFRLSFGSKDRAKCSMIIRKMFEELNEIDEIIPILKICSTSDKLRIVFDFNCNSVVDMVVETGSRSLGILYPIEGFVYIGAKNYETEFCQVIGSLIHELTHYAMKLTYENSCKPYHEDEKSEHFENISMATKQTCDENPSTDSIVTTVFSLYKENVWHQELIVRVPQLLAQYKISPKAVKAAERNTPELFHFYRNKTLKDVEAQSRVLLRKYLIGKINKQTGIARKIENLNVKFEIFEIDLKSSVNVITSNAPQLTLAMLHQVFPLDFSIFVTLEQVAIGNVLDKISKINAKESSTTLIVDCIGLVQKYSDSLRYFPKKIKNIKTIALVMTEFEGLIKEHFPSVEVELKTFNHKWDELTESSKANLLFRSVTFQGIEMKLSQLVEPSSKAMNLFPLGKILDGEDFKIGNFLHRPSHNFYIPRALIQKDQSTASAKDQNDDTNSEVILISDEAGSGKSVTLFEIAKYRHNEYPERWILFVDLKRHIEAFKSIEDHEKIKTFYDFVVQHILKNESEFEQELFKEMFRDGRTFVLFDGFDEISPNFMNLLLHVLKLFQPGSGNNLYITTRPHLEEDLKDALGNFVFKLEDLSEESQRIFLVKYWRSVSLEIRQEDLEVLLQRLLEKLSEIAVSNIVGLPLLMRMTVEIFDDPFNEDFLHKLESLSIHSVFQAYVQKYFARWINNENEISRNESVEFQMAGGVLETHHNIAIKHIFGEKFTSIHFANSDAEKISRIGLIRYDKTAKTFLFINGTFAQFFVADFICFHLNRRNRELSHDCSKAIELLVEVVASDKYHIIKKFLEQAFESMNFNLNEKLYKAVANCFGDVVKRKMCFDILRKVLKTTGENLALFLLSIINYVEKDILLKVLDSNENDVNNFEWYDYSALLIAVNLQTSRVFSSLHNIIITRIENPNGYIRSILMLKDSGGSNVLHYVAELANENVLNELNLLLRKYLPNNEIGSLLCDVNIEGRNCFLLAASNSKINIQIFRETFKDIIFIGDQTQLLQLATVDAEPRFFHNVSISKDKILIFSNHETKLKNDNDLEILVSNSKEDLNDHRTITYFYEENPSIKLSSETSTDVENPTSQYRNQIAENSNATNVTDGIGQNRFNFERQFVDNKGNVSSIEDLMKLAHEKKIMLLSGDPCTGKTISLRLISSELKSRLPSHIIEFVDLKLIGKDLKKFALGNSQDIADYFCSEYLQNKSGQQDFIRGFLSNEAIIFLDNFDEANQKHLNLIRSIKIITKNQVWVSIRRHLEQTMETTLQSGTHKILKFSPVDQTRFLREKLNNSVLSEKSFLITNREFQSYVNFLTGNAQTATNILILECLASTFKITTDSITETNYFHTFNNMMENYYKNIKRDVSVNKFALQKTAFQSIFKMESLEAQELIENLFRKDKFEKENLMRSKLVTWTNTKDVCLIYRPIGEFLIAEYFFKYLFQSCEHDKNAIDLFETIVSSANYVGIKMFFDEAFKLLNFDFYSAERAIVTLNIEGIFSHERLHNILHSFIRDGLPQLVLNLSSLLFECKAAEILKKLWQFEDQQQRNTIMIAAQLQSAEVFKEILDCVRTKLPLEVFLFHRNQQGQTVFFSAMQNEAFGIFDALVNLLPSKCNENLSKILFERDNENQNFMLFGLKLQQANCLSKCQGILEVIRNKYGIEAARTLIKSSDACFHISSQVLSPYFNENEIRDLLQSDNESEVLSSATSLNDFQDESTNQGNPSGFSSSKNFTTDYKVGGRHKNSHFKFITNIAPPSKRRDFGPPK